MDNKYKFIQYVCITAQAKLIKSGKGYIFLI